MKNIPAQFTAWRDEKRGEHRIRKESKLDLRSCRGVVTKNCKEATTEKEEKKRCWKDAGSRVKYWISCTISAFMIRKVKDKNFDKRRGLFENFESVKHKVFKEHNSFSRLLLIVASCLVTAQQYFPMMLANNS
ncbi:hypothetical protein TNIN_407341 [Trichonephila inaurata madagascariensis]|uniref:Uncharacterized protein n=1 Tax=Trichonephila inaurata madagascariensis TaxID=2747483 RepID=A0A8X6JHB3_9ARAC|nr:hypothetical protein TNIN_407341 [Trichonephila inaurata madagascariensis]